MAPAVRATNEMAEDADRRSKPPHTAIAPPEDYVGKQLFWKELCDSSGITDCRIVAGVSLLHARMAREWMSYQPVSRRCLRATLVTFFAILCA